MDGKMRATILLFTLLFSCSVAFADDAANEILDFIDDLYRESSSYTQMEMTIQSEHYTRTLELEGWSKGKEQSLIKILNPKKERGTTTLKVKKQIWNYLPKTNRIIKIPSSMMSAKWMGSHFTNDDLVKESRFRDDYNCTIQSKDGGKTVLDCIPLTNAVVVWGKVRLTVDSESYLPFEFGYYDEDFKVARTLYFSDIKTFGGKTIPSHLKMVPSDKPNEHTRIIYKDLNFQVKLKSDLFSLKELKRKSRK